MTRTIEIDIELNGYTAAQASLEYDIHGQHYPQTMTDPEEFPEIELGKLMMDDVDMTFLLEDNNDLVDHLTELCWEDANND